VLHALRTFIDRQPRHQLRSLLREAPWLVRFLPELLDLADAPLPLGALEARQERRLMFDAVRRYLAHAGGPGGVLVLLDNLQWASSDGLALLSSLVLAAEQAPLCMVGSYRDTEVETSGATGAWSAFITDLSRDGLARVLRLPVLTHDEAMTLA